MTQIKIVGKDSDFLHAFQECLENPENLLRPISFGKDGLLEELMKDTSGSNFLLKDHKDEIQNIPKSPLNHEAVTENV